MRYTQLFGKTQKTVPHEADSANARLLLQAGFVNQLAAGIYSYLPLGLRVIENIRRIIREEMNSLGAQEVLMPALTPKESWTTTGRWDEIDVMFKLEGHGEKEYGLGATHEEIVTPLVKEYVKSYRDLPMSVYQIQTKFRNEARAKSGLLRGREFLMKDLYSFHLSEEDFNRYYEASKEAYLRVFRRCGLDALIVEASGGVFSKYSHEFQVFTDAGEDIVFYCDCGWAQNKEIAEVDEGAQCPGCNEKQVKKGKAIEVGNIFSLKTRFTEAFDFKVPGPDGNAVPIIMGCYGIGLSRVMGAIVEVYHNDGGICWPKSVAPFPVHLVVLSAKDPAVAERVMSAAESMYDTCTREEEIEILFDDRALSAGEKFADADLIGLPLRIVVSERSLKEDSVEWKLRTDGEGRLVKLGDLHDELAAFMKE